MALVQLKYAVTMAGENPSNDAAKYKDKSLG